ncbi:STAS domain-containing protein [Aeromonas enteropelogenes]|uniref:STAS domain-containing protein n=1 Tax=Aeromonas enteropelogenes TaxID=29489 RepID=UPI003F790BC0
MELQRELQGDKTVLTLPDDVTIYTVAELKEALSPLLHQGQELELNLANVTEIDSAGLQLLLAAKKTALANGYPLHLVWHSHVVLELLELCQLSGFFGDPTLLPHAEHP